MVEPHFSHGWGPCRLCHTLGKEVTRHGQWHLRANPGYWGSSNPKVLVLGFSKGANQIKAASGGDFDKVAFARMRPRLSKVLATLGLLQPGADMDRLLSASGQGLGAASLLRCGLSLEKSGKLETSGPIIAMSLQHPWTRDRIQRCVRSHLVNMPSSVTHVVLLGNDDRYVAGVKQIMRSVFPDYRDVNPMAFHARGATWVFAVHPSPANGHFADWDLNESGKQATKCRTAVAALSGSLTVAAPTPATTTPVAERQMPASPPSQPGRKTQQPETAEAPSKARGNRFATSFHLVGARGEVLRPVRQARGNPAFVLAKRGSKTHHKEFKIEVMDENQAYQMVASGTYKIRAIRHGDKAPSLVGLGDRAVKQVVRT